MPPIVPKPEPRRRWMTSLTVWLFLSTFLIRLVVLARFSGSPYLIPEGGDMKFYNDWALRILKGTLTDHHAFYGLPGYAFFLAGVYSLLGYNPFVVGLLQCASEAGTGIILFKLAGIVFQDSAGRRASQFIGVCSSLGWAFFEPAQAFSIILMPTTWLVLAYWGCVLWVVQTRSCSAWTPWLWMGILTGAVATMVATILFLIVLILAAIWMQVDIGKPLLARMPKLTTSLVMLFAGVLAGMSPCWVHNYFIAKDPVLLSAHSGVNFYIGNNPIANGYPKIPPGLRAGQAGMLQDSITMAETAAGHPLPRSAVSHYWSEKADVYIHSHFLEWIRLICVKFKNFWNSFQYDDLSLVTLLEEEGFLTPSIRFGLVAAFGLAGMIIAGVRVPRSRWIIAAILLHMSALLPVFITERYRMAAAPGLLLLGAYALWTFWNSLIFSRWKESIALCSLSAASTMFVSWPVSDSGLWSLDYYNTGIKATDAGHLARAEEKLELAYDYVPNNSEINFALGNLWVKKGELRKAKAFYRRTLELNPRHAGAHENLGMLALNERQWSIAQAFLGRAAEIEPTDAKTHFLLSEALLEQGNLSGADGEISKALTLAPERKEFIEMQSKIRSRER